MPNVKYFYGGERAKKTGAFKRNYSHSFWSGLMKFPKGNKTLIEMHLHLMSKIYDFKTNKKFLAIYAQTTLGLRLKKKYGDNFLNEQKINIDLMKNELEIEIPATADLVNSGCDTINILIHREEDILTSELTFVLKEMCE